mmetsp:Transcript_15422/g.23451  ORF Transcript_15422/g.23451 Transcript_15422/m.23451 type:complete len:95 (+) Transcript_15422:1900-2184(+)
MRSQKISPLCFTSCSCSDSHGSSRFHYVDCLFRKVKPLVEKRKLDEKTLNTLIKYLSAETAAEIGQKRKQIASHGAESNNENRPSPPKKVTACD